MGAAILSPTVSALGSPTRDTLDRVHSAGFRAVQLSAAQPGMRPRDLDQSARRDVIASLRRRELALSGIDHLLPLEHFDDPSFAHRAVETTIAAIGLARDLGQVVLSVNLPPAGAARLEIARRAQFEGVPLADCRPGAIPEPPIGIGLDPAALLAAGLDPVQSVFAAGPLLLAPRLSDLSTGGMRVIPGAAPASGGRLSFERYAASVATISAAEAVIVDLRQLDDPWRAAETVVSCWDRALGPARWMGRPS